MDLSTETSVGVMLEKMNVRLRGIVPDIELRYKAELVCDINRLKKEKNAVILAIIIWNPRFFTPSLTSSATL